MSIFDKLKNTAQQAVTTGDPKEELPDDPQSVAAE